MLVACVSDVCLGYGSPQITALMTSLSRHFQAETLVLEPHRSDSPPRHNRYPNLRIRRLRTPLDPYTEAGRVAYLLAAAQVLNQGPPDLLVICCTFCLPVLLKLRRHPGFVIYYSYESISFYGPFDVELNRHLSGLVNLVVFPEENRAAREVEQCGFNGAPKVILYNCPEVDDPATAENNWSKQRNGRVVYFGTIHRDLTLSDYYTRPETRGFPIDLYGPIRGCSEEERQRFVGELPGQVRYCGHLDSKEMAEARKDYSYSLVMWNPSVENQLYAAPNKFFESIADGIPPIAAPHPQCRTLIRRYQCGLLMPDWSYEGFCATLRKALRLRQTDQWREMVHNCGLAVRRELNWYQQFEKLKLHLRG